MKYISSFFATLLLFLTLQCKAQNAEANIDVTHYEIHINEINFTEHTIEGEAFIQLTATTQTDAIVMELKALEVQSVSATDADIANFAQSGDEITINLATALSEGQTATLDIRYGGNTYNESWGGLHWWGDYVYNLGVGINEIPHNLGKAWFPCVDNFSDKASYDLFITVENSKKAVCGGVLVAATDNGDGTTTWHWNTPQEIATYHISMAVGDYEMWEETYHGIAADIPVTVYAKPNQMDKVAGTFINIKEIAAFFEACFGPYPFNRIGYVSTGLGCMEHTDNIALASSVITGNTTQEEYLAHEMSHQWFGNKVTCATAEEMWLNEGFGQFCGLFYTAGVYDEATFHGIISSLTETITNWCNNPSNWIPLNQIPLDMTYDGNAVYDRGAVVVNTMMNYMGRETFLAALRHYLEQHAYQTANTEQLMQALSEASGIDMSHFFDTYVLHAGLPHYAIQINDIQQDGNRYEATLQLNYKHIGSTYVSPFNRMEVTFFDANGADETHLLEFGADNLAQVSLDIQPVAVFVDYDNHFLDGKTDRNYMLTTTTSPTFANFKAIVNSLSDSTLFRIENHLIGPGNDPEIPALSISTKHYWNIFRHDFGTADITGEFTYSKSADDDIIQTENDSATLLYRANSTEPWREIAHTLHPQSTWKLGKFIVEDILPGEYCVAVWDKEHFSVGEMQQQGFQVFPNPTDGQINLKWDETLSGKIVISDIRGNIVDTVPFANSKSLAIPTNGIAQGIYSITCLDKNGSILAIKKIIVR